MSFHVEDSFFKQDFIGYVDSIVKNIELEDGKLHNIETDSVHENGRSCLVGSFEDHAISDALYKLLCKYNSKHYGFDIWPDPEIQYMVYSGENRGHIDWHNDENIETESPRPRKFSMSVQLSDPSDYTGGNFEAYGIDFDKGIRNQGSVITFPSYESHRITPVTKGIRKSLVAWFHGPRWR